MLRPIAICLLLACIPTAAPAASPVGYWYGQGYQPTLREVTQQIAHYGEDGSFEIRFFYKNCVLTWGLTPRSVLPAQLLHIFYPR